MVVFKCVSCGATLEVEDGAEVCVCNYCRTKQSVPSDVIKHKVDLHVTGSIDETANHSRVEGYVKRGYMLLEEGNFIKAYSLFDESLNLNPENSRAYIGLFMAENGVRTESEISKLDIDILINSSNFRTALKTADNEYKEYIHDRINSAIYACACSKMKESDYDKAINGFNLIPGYKDVDIKLMECNYLIGCHHLTNCSYMKAIKYLKESKGYKDADVKFNECNYYLGNNHMKYKEYDYAIEYFTEIPGYKNTDTLIKDCIYKKGLVLEKEREYSEAVETFSKILTYKDAALHAESCKNSSGKKVGFFAKLHKN